MPLLSNIKSLLGLALLSMALVGCDAGLPEPNLAPAQAKAAQCVEPTADMRKNHMVYLDAHRDQTVIEGIRTTQHSLNACINCHVAPTREDGSAVHYTDAKQDHFCASCHTYVGVKIDCFQCHADRPQVAENPNYQHKLSSNSYHLSAKSGLPEVSDLLLLGQSQIQGATQ
jgi:hypothetical protein